MFFFFFFFFSLPFYKGDKFCDLVCFPVHQVPFEKGSSLKGKTLLLRESLAFQSGPLFSGEAKTILTELPPLDLDPVPLSICSMSPTGYLFGHAL